MRVEIDKFYKLDFDNQIESGYLLKFDNFDCKGSTKVNIINFKLDIDDDTIKEDLISNLSNFNEDLKMDIIEDFISPPILNMKWSKLQDSKFEHKLEVIEAKNQSVLKFYRKMTVMLEIKFNIH